MNNTCCFDVVRTDVGRSLSFFKSYWLCSHDQSNPNYTNNNNSKRKWNETTAKNKTNNNLFYWVCCISYSFGLLVFLYICSFCFNKNSYYRFLEHAGSSQVKIREGHRLEKVSYCSFLSMNMGLVFVVYVFPHTSTQYVLYRSIKEQYGVNNAFKYSVSLNLNRAPAGYRLSQSCVQDT